MAIRGNWHRRRLSRRVFLSLGGMSAAALALGSCRAHSSSGAVGYGPLVQDPAGILDLPSGFQYRIISEEGSTLSNGAPVPGAHDGMGAFPGAGDTTILVRNHELQRNESPPVVGKNPYRSSQRGGTTGIVVGPDRKEIKDFVTSSGTLNNCAGGATPWGTWLTCEETRNTNHGYVFEVDPRNPENKLSKTPIRAMGYFSHEAAGVDPTTGIVYLTEDDFRGTAPPDPNDEVVGTSRVSFLYRYVPVNSNAVPGALQQGGKLQVMTLQQGSYNADLANPGQKFGVLWNDVNPEEPHADAEAKGAARFNRLEGAYFAGRAFWFDDTEGGEGRLGQVFRYLPDTQTLELFYEGTQDTNMKSPDNIVVTPWGDLWFAEDGTGRDRIMAITPGGQVYAFASNRLNDSEFAGPCFSPDGQTFFVNIHDPGMTFAVWGPFTQPSAAAKQQMALAAPPEFMKPEISAELAEAAEQFGMSELEAAAYDRLGVSLV
jgi:secreted PhoX family phosphatase